MKEKLKAAILVVVGTLVSFQTLAAAVDPARCIEWGDSLEQPQAAGRREWAWKCFPQYRHMIKENEEFLDRSTNTKRPGYPTFRFIHEDASTSNPLNWFAPISANAPCDYPNGYMLTLFCAAGCYTPDQLVWFEDGYRAIGIAKQKGLKNIKTLSESSTMDNLEFITSPVEYFIADPVDTEQTILNFIMATGGKLRVTENHPLVDGDGKMRSADTLRVGDSLVKTDGSRDLIIAITPEEYFGKVYNVEVKTNSLIQKVISAEGYLNGSVYYQNEGVKDLNRMILRANLVTEELVR